MGAPNPPHEATHTHTHTQQAGYAGSTRGHLSDSRGPMHTARSHATSNTDRWRHAPLSPRNTRNHPTNKGGHARNTGIDTTSGAAHATNETTHTYGGNPHTRSRNDI